MTGVCVVTLGAFGFFDDVFASAGALASASPSVAQIARAANLNDRRAIARGPLAVCISVCLLPHG